MPGTGLYQQKTGLLWESGHQSLSGCWPLGPCACLATVPPSRLGPKVAVLLVPIQFPLEISCCPPPPTIPNPSPSHFPSPARAPSFRRQRPVTCPGLLGDRDPCRPHPAEPLQPRPTRVVGAAVETEANRASSLPGSGGGARLRGRGSGRGGASAVAFSAPEERVGRVVKTVLKDKELCAWLV